MYGFTIVRRAFLLKGTAKERVNSFLAKSEIRPQRTTEKKGESQRFR
jgi:hypothetical protein